MKTYLTYGFAAAFANLLLAVLLFFVGLHSDPAKLGTAQMIGFVGSVLIYAVLITLGTKARRADTPASEPFGYGRALGAGVMIALFAAVFGAIGHWLYMTVINPGFVDTMMQAQVAQWEAMGMSGEQIENAESITRKFMHPAVQAGFALVFSFIFGTVVALVTSAFLKRSEVPPIPTTA